MEERLNSHCTTPRTHHGRAPPGGMGSPAATVANAVSVVRGFPTDRRRQYRPKLSAHRPCAGRTRNRATRIAHCLRAQRTRVTARRRVVPMSCQRHGGLGLCSRPHAVGALHGPMGPSLRPELVDFDASCGHSMQRTSLRTKRRSNKKRTEL